MEEITKEYEKNRSNFKLKFSINQWMCKTAAESESEPPANQAPKVIESETPVELTDQQRLN